MVVAGEIDSMPGGRSVECGVELTVNEYTNVSCCGINSKNEVNRSERYLVVVVAIV